MGADRRLVPSPATEALAVIGALRAAIARPSLDSSAIISDSTLGTTQSLKLALFNLQKYIKEEDFAVEFLLKGGLALLVRLLHRGENGVSGNSLAVRIRVGLTESQYALQGIRGILEFEVALRDITDDLVDRVLYILVTSGQTNILRPATSIVRKLVHSSAARDDGAMATSVTGPNLAKIASQDIDTPQKTAPNPFNFTTTRSAKGKFRAVDESSAVWSFSRVWDRLSRIADGGPGVGSAAERLFNSLAKRLEPGADLELISQT